MEREVRAIEQFDRIDRKSWDDLVEESPVATWFQTPEAYLFFSLLNEIWAPFVVAIENESGLRGVAVGIIQKDGGKLKQFLSRRAIIMGGPVLADDITNEELAFLLNAISKHLQGKAIYIETRNFNDYGRWRPVFEANGFGYDPHLNFHVHCDNWEEVERRIGKHRRRYIRLSIREGVTVVESPSLDQVRQYYAILEDLYRTKVKMPLYPWHFFEQLYKLDTSRFILIEYDGQIIGGSVCVCLNDRGVYEWFACGKDGVYKNVHPSSMTKYAGMKFAHDHHYPIFDMMGAGKPDEKYGVRDFKAEFGGEMVEHGRYRYVANKPLYALGKIGVKLLKWL